MEDDAERNYPRKARPLSFIYRQSHDYHMIQIKKYHCWNMQICKSTIPIIEGCVSLVES